MVGWGKRRHPGHLGMMHPLLPVGRERPSPGASSPEVASPNGRFRPRSIASLLTWHHGAAAGPAVTHLDACFRTGRAWRWAGTWSGERPGRECSGSLWPRIQDGGRGVGVSRREGLRGRCGRPRGGRLTRRGGHSWGGRGSSCARAA